MFLLRLDIQKDSYTVTNQSTAALDDLVGNIETPIVDFMEGPSGSLMDDQDRPCFIADNVDELKHRLLIELANREAFFDELNDPAAPSDEDLYRIIGCELDLLNKALRQL